MAILERESYTFEVRGEYNEDNNTPKYVYDKKSVTSYPLYEYTIGVYAKEDGFHYYDSSNFTISLEYPATSDEYISAYTVSTDTFSVEEHLAQPSISAKIYEQYKYYQIIYNYKYNSSSEHVANKNSIVELPTPTQSGYKFLYWKDNNGNKFYGGSNYECSTQLLFDKNADCNLTAVWESEDDPATYTITYNANGGSGGPTYQTKTHNVTLTLSSDEPTRGGYTFLGWSTSSTATLPTYYAGGNYTANASATLYAVWAKTATTYTIRFDANGGVNAPSAQTKTHSVAITLSSVTPTRSNYTFLGWSTDPSAFSPTYTAGSTYTSDSNATLYAIWKVDLIEVGDLIYSNAPLSDVSTGVTLATINTTCNKNVGVRLNYLDIIKLNNPANILDGQFLFEIEGTYSGDIIAQSGIVIHDKTSTTIYPFYGSDSELSNVTWSVTSEGVAFNTGNRHHRFLNTNVNSLVGLNGETDISVGNSNSTYLTANVVKEYKVVYGGGSEPETPTEKQEFTFDFRGSNGNQIYWSKIKGTEAVLTWENDGTTGGYNILKINGVEIIKDSAIPYAGLSVEDDLNVTSLNDIEASSSPTTLTVGGTYTYYLYMTNEINN